MSQNGAPEHLMGEKRTPKGSNLELFFRSFFALFQYCMPDRAERVSKGSQYDILDSFSTYFGLILDDFGLILEICWRYVGYILRVFLNEYELSNPTQRTAKNHAS